MQAFPLEQAATLPRAPSMLEVRKKSVPENTETEHLPISETEIRHLTDLRP